MGGPAPLTRAPGASSPLAPRRQLRQVESSPFKPGRANQGLARPAASNARGSRASGSRPSRLGDTGVGAGEPAASVTGKQQNGLGLQARQLVGRRLTRGWDAMERSLHRVSLGRQRAHRDLSFYLTTFGKCLSGRLCPTPERRPLPAMLASKAGAPIIFLTLSTWGFIYAFFLLCPEHRLKRPEAAGHHLLPLHWCQASWFCLTGLE